jgi:hypothetical protein
MQLASEAVLWSMFFSILLVGQGFHRIWVWPWIFFNAILLTQVLHRLHLMKSANEGGNKELLGYSLLVIWTISYFWPDALVKETGVRPNAGTYIFILNCLLLGFLFI